MMTHLLLNVFSVVLALLLFIWLEVFFLRRSINHQFEYLRRRLDEKGEGR